MDLSRCIYRRGVEEAASSFIIRSAGTGSRTIVNYNGLEEMSVGEFEEVVRGAGSEGEKSWWHFEVSPPAIISISSRSIPQNLQSRPIQQLQRCKVLPWRKRGGH